jgi:holliday junction DNA helicase RuvA
MRIFALVTHNAPHLDFRPVIAHLTGTLLLKQPNAVVIDVGGVGYEVTIPVSSFYDLGEVGDPVSLRIYTYVREDTLQLFGFRTGREKELFLRLMTVSGIGPKLAITLLSGMSVDELIPAIRSNDLGRLTSIPGVGRKTAERIVVELRDRMAALSSPEAEAQFQAMPVIAGLASIRDDTVAALLTLGYQKAQAEKVVGRVLEQEKDHSIEHILRQSLKQLSR